MNLWLGIPAVIISAVVGAAAFSQYSKDYPWLGIVAGFLAISGAVLSGVTTFLNPNDKENTHVTAAHAFDTLNNDCRLFWSIDCWREDSEEILTSKLRELVDRKNELNSTSPQIPQWAYKQAKAGIDAGEAKFQVDSEAPATPPAPGPDAAAGQ
jgi:hypothetical protein